MNGLMHSSKLFMKRNASTILTCMGGAGVVVTAIMAVKATPKALERLDEAKKEKGEDLTKMEAVRATGVVYIPSAMVGMATIACVFGANTLNKRQQAALMSAYALLDSSYKEYKNKVIEMQGEEFDKEVRTEVAKDHYKDADIQNEDDGKQLFYDEYSHRYFRASNETILSAEYAINKVLTEDCYASLNELYDLFEIDKIDGGDVVGWSSAQMFDMYWSSWIDFYHEKVEMEDGMECFIIHYTEPMIDFEDY